MVPATTPPSARSVVSEVRSLGNSDDAVFLQRFFRTGPGEYGEGDRFLGVRVPVVRKLARRHRDLPLDTLRLLLGSPWHEVRLLALLILVHRYGRGDDVERQLVFDLYLEKIDRVNSWDLVDSSAPHIVGAHLASGDRALLDRLAVSTLWHRRIAMLATFHFIRNGEYDDALRIAGTLLHDGHDLIHKAVGWMLREVGNRDRATEERFLQRHYREMPRTMLRHAIEKFPPERRREYLAGLA